MAERFTRAWADWGTSFQDELAGLGQRKEGDDEARMQDAVGPCSSLAHGRCKSSSAPLRKLA